jgi:serine protease
MVWAAGFSVAGVPANPNPARVINLSFGGSAACSSSYQDVINQVTAAGVLVVVAAGNDSGLAMRPADCANVLAVGAVGQAGTKAYYSDVGPTIGLVAPGGILSSSSSVTTTGMYSTSNTGVTTSVADTLRSEQGTSFSAPMAAGVASLMLSINPGLSPAQLIARMQAGARPHPVTSLPYCSLSYAQACNCTTSVCGAGLLDASAALGQAGNPAASIATIATQLPGASISLDGRASTSVAGSTITTYAWSQTSGAPATLSGANAALASAVLPAAAGSFVFRLQVTDNQGRIGSDTVTVVAAVPVAAASSASAAVGGGGGASGWLWGLGLWLLALAVPRQWPVRRPIRRRVALSPAAEA